MTTVLLVLQFVLTGILTVAVLLQKSSSIGLGAYSGSNESLFGAKGPAGFMAKFTFVVGILFIANTLALGYFTIKIKKFRLPKISKSKERRSSTPAPMPSAPSAPEAPSTK